MTTDYTTDLSQINEADARKLAAAAGLAVSKVVKSSNGTRSLTVGNVTVYHDGRGGAGCWRVAGEVARPCPYAGVARSQGRFLGQSIRAAISRQ